MCLKQNNIVNLYMTYKLNALSQDLISDFTLGNCLFGAVNPTKSADSDKYSGYDIGFDSPSQFSWTDGNVAKNVIIFG